MPAAGWKLTILRRRRPFLGVFWGKKLLLKVLGQDHVKVGGERCHFPPQSVIRHNFFVSWWIHVRFSGELKWDIRRRFPVFLVVGGHIGHPSEGYLKFFWKRLSQNRTKNQRKITQKSFLKNRYQGYHNLAPRDLDSRNERFRLTAFQNIQKILNRSSINIFLGRRKLMGSRKKSEAERKWP